MVGFDWDYGQRRHEYAEHCERREWCDSPGCGGGDYARTVAARAIRSQPLQRPLNGVQGGVRAHVTGVCFVEFESLVGLVD